AVKIPTSLKCPVCPDGGRKKLIKVDHASEVFEPLPKGWHATEYVLQCQCGWSMPLDHPEEAGRPIAPR
ncbi:MAG TPA: hypothetical protein VMP01_02280, partial [Pirellulaceae bacterium]|nr:hypothetical protein [Pirellulaceae bacterium]